MWELFLFLSLHLFLFSISMFIFIVSKAPRDIIQIPGANRILLIIIHFVILALGQIIFIFTLKIINFEFPEHIIISTSLSQLSHRNCTFFRLSIGNINELEDSALKKFKNGQIPWRIINTKDNKWKLINSGGYDPLTWSQSTPMEVIFQPKRTSTFLNK